MQKPGYSPGSLRAWAARPTGRGTRGCWWGGGLLGWGLAPRALETPGNLSHPEGEGLLALGETEKAPRWEVGGAAHR